MLQTRWRAEAWPQVRVEFKKAFALRSSLRRAGWLRREGVLLAVSLLSSARLLSVRVRWRVGESDAGSAVAVDYVQRAETTDPHRPTFNQGVVGSSPTPLTDCLWHFWNGPFLQHAASANHGATEFPSPPQRSSDDLQASRSPYVGDLGRGVHTAVPSSGSSIRSEHVAEPRCERQPEQDSWTNGLGARSFTRPGVLGRTPGSRGDDRQVSCDWKFVK
jgi:hypothetical protein